MKNISFYIPKIEDYWYEQKIQSDPETMSYNAGYDVSYDGYHYDTGCIDFDKDKWETVYNKRINSPNFFAYIKDNNIGIFVGYCNYHYNPQERRYECGIVIEAKHREKGYSKEVLKMLCEKAKKDGVDSLYDSFEVNRCNTLKVFEAIGFTVVEKIVWKKFGEDVDGVVVKINL